MVLVSILTTRSCCGGQKTKSASFSLQIHVLHTLFCSLGGCPSLVSPAHAKVNGPSDDIHHPWLIHVLVSWNPKGKHLVICPFPSR